VLFIVFFSLPTSSIFLITVNFLAALYIEGESTYTIEEDDRMTNVVVNHTKYILSADAFEKFKAVHDEWELKVWQKFLFDSLIGGTHKNINKYIWSNLC
jgi:hypothetical protein